MEFSRPDLLDSERLLQPSSVARVASPVAIRLPCPKPSSGTIHLLARIDEWSRTAPARLAFRSASGTLTYAELDRRSSALAGWLSHLPGRSSAPVAIRGHKEPEMLVGFLAAWKAGRAYVPIDSSFPASRVETIVKESGAIELLKPERIRTLGAQSHSARPVRPRPDDVCYVIFTSGSTGAPKGVPITHGNLAHFVGWMSAEQRFSAGAETFLNQANFSFDLSVMDLYLCLAHGGTLLSLTREEMSDPHRLFAGLSGSGLTTWVSTPSFARLALLHPGFTAEALPELRRFLFCGETLAPQIAAELQRRFPQSEIWNTYGPTEATVATTSIRIDPAMLERYPALPVGRAMPGTRVLIVDEHGRRQPAGGHGEILIAGPNVSPGYLGPRHRSAKAFAPYEGVPAYRTGDSGYERDGLIFFEGRVDQQVKLRGYRIELGDIEANLREIDGVIDAVVLPIERDAELCCLAAVVVLTDGKEAGEPEAAWLRRELESRLPAYMVPTRIRFRESFPLTANGKTDRRALLADVAVVEPSSMRPVVNPAAVEQQITAAWATLLDLAQIRPDQSFFELGGDSLLATRLLLEVEKITGRRLPESYLYRHPKLGQFLAGLVQECPTENDDSLIPVQAGASGPALFWLPGATASATVLLGYTPHIPRLARELGEKQAVYSLYMEHREASAEVTIEKLAAELLAAIRGRQPAGPYCFVGWSFGGLMAYEMARQLELRGEKVALLALIDTPAPFYPCPRPWRQRPAAAWRHWSRLSAIDKLTKPVATLSRWLEKESKELRRRLGRALGRETPWDRVIQLEAEYLAQARRYEGHVTVFASTATLADAKGAVAVSHDETLGWRELAGSVESHTVTGDHHSMLQQPGLGQIAHVLRQRLGELSA